MKKLLSAILFVLLCPLLAFADRAVQVESILAGLTDISGEPLAGGLVYTYEAGTTTPKSVYTDQAATTAATNPVVLDAQGRGQVFGQGAYKFVVKTSAGSSLYTWDNLQYVYPSSLTLYAGTSTGSSSNYSVTPSPALTAYTDGQTVAFIANHQNTGATTLNISSLGAKAVKKIDGTTALSSADITSGMLVNVIYVASSDHFRILNTAGTLPITAGGTGSTTAGGAVSNIGAQPVDAQLTDVAGLTPTDNNFIVGNGSNFVTESGATARTSMGAAASGSNGDITAMTANASMTAGSAMTIRTTGAQVLNLGTDATNKVIFEAGTSPGTAIKPSADATYALGTTSAAWNGVVTYGLAGPTSSPLTIQAQTGQSIPLKIGSTTYWTLNSSGQLVWAASPDYSPEAFTYTTRRALNPAAATAASCADAINTLWQDLITAGVLH